MGLNEGLNSHFSNLRIISHNWKKFLTITTFRYNEIDDYSYDTASSINGKAIGHFTQVVWKGTMKFGVGIATMDSRKYSQ